MHLIPRYVHTYIANVKKINIKNKQKIIMKNYL